MIIKFDPVELESNPNVMFDWKMGSIDVNFIITVRFNSYCLWYYYDYQLDQEEEALNNLV